MGGLFAIGLSVFATQTAPAQTLTVLKSFNENFGATQGFYPEASVLFNQTTGALFSTTGEGGDLACGGTNGGCGVAFELAPNAKHVATVYRRLHVFGATGADGTFPQSGLVADSHGNLYGTTPGRTASELDTRTPEGPANCAFAGCGIVFMLKKPATASGQWVETILHTFTGGVADGANPKAALILNAKTGALYGTTCDGGSKYAGTVFRLAPSAKGKNKWSFAVLYNFSDTADGGCPMAPLARDGSGNLYGTTYFGGDPNCACGTVFELSPVGAGWKKTGLHTFAGDVADGAHPGMGLVLDSQGDLFGTTHGGGVNSSGAAFEIPKTAKGFGPEKLITSFATNATPSGDRLAIDAKLNLFGTSEFGGANGDAGTIFELISSAGNWTPTVLYNFCATVQNNECADGAYPNGTVLDRAGNLYGTTQQGGPADTGIAFEFTPAPPGVRR